MSERKASKTMGRDARKVARHYDLLVKNGNDPVLDGEALRQYMDGWDGQVFLDLLGLDGRQNVLEIGCGTGRIAMRVADQCRQYVGVDCSPITVDTARRHFGGKDHVRFVCDDFLRADLRFCGADLRLLGTGFQGSGADSRLYGADLQWSGVGAKGDDGRDFGVFDVVFSTLTFLHIRKKKRAINKVFSLLNRGGRFVLSVSKDRARWVDTGYSKIRVYPDDAAKITRYLAGAGFAEIERRETERAVVFCAKKA